MERHVLHLASFHVVLLFFHRQCFPVGVNDPRQLIHRERFASHEMMNSTRIVGVNDIALLLRKIVECLLISPRILLERLIVRMRSYAYHIHHRTHSISGNIEFASSDRSELLLGIGLAAFELFYSFFLQMIVSYHQTTRIMALIASFSEIKLSFVKFKRCSNIFSTVLNRTVLGMNDHLDSYSISATHFK